MELKFNTFNWNEVIEKVQKMQENGFNTVINTTNNNGYSVVFY